MAATPTPITGPLTNTSRRVAPGRLTKAKAAPVAPTAMTKDSSVSRTP